MRFKVLMSVFALIALSYPGSKHLDALPQNEVDTLYFSDETMTEIVGERDILCVGGVYQWGMPTPWKMIRGVNCQFGTSNLNVCFFESWDPFVGPYANPNYRVIPIPCVGPYNTPGVLGF